MCLWASALRAGLKAGLMGSTESVPRLLEGDTYEGIGIAAKGAALCRRGGVVCRGGKSPLGGARAKSKSGRRTADGPGGLRGTEEHRRNCGIFSTVRPVAADCRCHHSSGAASLQPSVQVLSDS